MNNNKGFTLIELIVVMAVFLFVIGGALTIFISIVEHQKRVLAEQEFLNQISYTEEYMSKALRMAKDAATNSDLDCMGLDNLGYIYLLTRPDISTGMFNGIKFINQAGVDSSGNPAEVCQEFYLDHEDPGDTSSPLVLKEIKGNNPPVDLTSPSMGVQLVSFAINGSDGSAKDCTSTNQCGACNDSDKCGAWATVQPKVTIVLNVKIPGDGQNSFRTIQTTISQRNLNVK